MSEQIENTFFKTNFSLFRKQLFLHILNDAELESIFGENILSLKFHHHYFLMKGSSLVISNLGNGIRRCLLGFNVEVSASE
jgi:hypothetical protein